MHDLMKTVDAEALRLLLCLFWGGTLKARGSDQVCEAPAGSPTSRVLPCSRDSPPGSSSVDGDGGRPLRHREAHMHELVHVGD